MFGGQGIYADGMIVAVVIHSDLMLKIDVQTEAAFAAAGSRRWRYRRTGKAAVRMPYATLPDEAFDDPERAAHWSRLALDAAYRSTASKKPKRASRSTPGTGSEAETK